MKRRGFLTAVIGVVLAPWKLLSKQHSVETPSFNFEDPKPRLIRDIFPTDPSQLPGLYCINRHESIQVFPYEIIREFDEWNDKWEGQELSNPRRNKWWAKAVDGSTVLICTGSKFNDFESTMFFKKI